MGGFGFPSILKVRPKQLIAYTTGGDVTHAGDLQVSTSRGSGYAAPADATFFTAAGMTTAERFIRVPMDGWRDVAVGVFNNSLLGAASAPVTLTVKLYLWLAGVGNTGNFGTVESQALASGSEIYLTPDMPGEGTNVNVIYEPILRSPMAYLIIGITPDIQPVSGDFRIHTVRRS